MDSKKSGITSFFRDIAEWNGKGDTVLRKRRLYVVDMRTWSMIGVNHRNPRGAGGVQARAGLRRRRPNQDDHQPSPIPQDVA